MPLPDVTEKWSGSINEVVLGTGEGSITVGGQSTLPFLDFEGATPNKTIVAMEILDTAPTEWSEVTTDPFDGVMNDPVEWAQKCIEDYGAEMICVSLNGIHPDFGDLPAEHALKVVDSVANAIDVPLMIWGSGNADKDNTVMPLVAEALKGKNALLGSADEGNYKTLVAACQMAGHNIITESPCDINIAKQVNILVTDDGFPLDRIVMYPTTGALGYGFEYIYTIIERGRLAALSGDKMMSPPVICRVGPEVWRVKEATAPLADQPNWGDPSERGPMWESLTAGTLLMCGGDIMIMRHPQAVKNMKQLIGELMNVG